MADLPDARHVFCLLIDRGNLILGAPDEKKGLKLGVSMKVIDFTEFKKKKEAAKSQEAFLSEYEEFFNFDDEFDFLLLDDD